MKRHRINSSFHSILVVLMVLSFMVPFAGDYKVSAQVPPPAAPAMIALEIFAQTEIAPPAPLAGGARADSTALLAGAPVGSSVLFVIFGAVSGVNAAGTEWQIGTPPTFVYTHAGTRLQGAPVAGSTVRIVGIRSLIPGPIMAEVITLRPAGAAVGSPADVTTAFLFNGTVTAASPTLWTVGGINFAVDTAVIDAGLGAASAVTVEFSVPVVIPPPPPGTVVAPPPIPAAAAAAAPMTFGAVNPVTRVPVWFRDAAGIALDFCVDPVLCIADPVDSANPFSVQTGFGAEAFYWSAGATLPTTGGRGALLVLAWEVAYLNGDPAPGETIFFGRIRTRVDGLTPGATYTVTHPFGTDTFVATSALVNQINVTDDTGCFAVPCDFNAALASRVKRFLVWDPAQSAPPAGFVGNPGIAHRVIGSPTGNNFFRIDGPNVGGPGINRIQTDLFNVSGRILPAAAAAMTVTPANQVIVVGTTLGLAASATDQFGVSIGVTPTFTSSNLAAGTVDPVTGVVTAVAPGTTTITATSGALTGTTTVAVSTATPVLTRINVTPATATVVVPNTQALAAAALDQFSAAFTTTPAFTSSNPLLGTVDPVTGLFTAVGAGTVTVTATSGTVTGTATVRVVTAAPTLGTIAITPPTATIAMGSRPTFTASALDQFGVTIEGAVTFASSNAAVGSINAAGVFTPRGAGTTTVSATSGTITGSATVTVTSPGMRAAGPANPANGYPRYYTDASGLSLELCLDTNGFCVLAPLPNPAAALSFPGNFPDESFYYAANSNRIPVGTGTSQASLRMVLEAAFLTGTPEVGQNMTFLRINLPRMAGLTPNSTYTVTYPFGTFTFATDAAGNTIGIQATRIEEGCAAAPCDFTLLLPAPLTLMTNFPAWTGLPAGGLAGPGGNYIGDNSTPHTIIPGPNGNFFRIDGPNIGGPSVNRVQTDLWVVSGKIAPAAVVAAAAVPVAAAATTPVGTPAQIAAAQAAAAQAAAAQAAAAQAAAAQAAAAQAAAAQAAAAPAAPVGSFIPTNPATPAPIPARPPAFIGGGGGGGVQIFGGGGGGPGPSGSAGPSASAGPGGGGSSSGVSGRAGAPVVLPPGTIAPARGPVKISPASTSGGDAPAAPRPAAIVEMGGEEYRVDFTRFNPAGQVSTIVAIKGGVTVSFGSDWTGFTPDQVLANAIFNNDPVAQAIALAAGAKPLGEVK